MRLQWWIQGERGETFPPKMGKNFKNGIVNQIFGRMNKKRRKKYQLSFKFSYFSNQNGASWIRSYETQFTFSSTFKIAASVFQFTELKSFPYDTHISCD